MSLLKYLGNKCAGVLLEMCLGALSIPILGRSAQVVLCVTPQLLQQDGFAPPDLSQQNGLTTFCQGLAEKQGKWRFLKQQIPVHLVSLSSHLA